MFNKHPLIQIIIAVASLASIGIFIHKSDISPVTTGFYRCLFSLPMLVLLNIFNKTSLIVHNLKINKTKIIIITIIGGIGLALDMIVFNLSFKYTTMAETNLIVNLTPLLIFPITIFYFKERASFWMIIPFLLALLGLYGLVFSSINNQEFHIKGDLMALLAAIFYAIFVIATKVVADSGVNMNKYMIWITICCLILLFLFGIINNDTWLPYSFLGWVDLFLLAIISQIFGQLFLAQAIKKVPLQMSSVLLLLQPIFAAIYGFILFNEKLSIIQIIGAITVIFAVYLFKHIEYLNNKKI